MISVVKISLISLWFDHGTRQGMRRLIVWRDLFDHSCYPEYSNLTGDMLRGYVAGKDGQNMQSLVEVYDLTAGKGTQLAAHRAFNY